jgi:hypothetical protein
MTFDALFDRVLQNLSNTDSVRHDIRLLLGRIPKEHYADFLSFYDQNLLTADQSELEHLATTITRFNDQLIEAGNRDEVIDDLEEKLGRLAPTLLNLGFLSASPPNMSWALIQNCYRLVADNRMLLFDFTKTEFEIIQAIKLDRAIRLVHRDAGEFIPYVKKHLSL